jgi:SAM-dependent methyltransferase
LRELYDGYADDYGGVRNPRYDAFRDEVLDWFAAQALPVGDRVLDLGSGPGREAVALRERGLCPLAVDLSPRMVGKCRERGLDAEVMDLAELDLPEAAFAGAWISFSLLHLPKRLARSALAAVAHALVPGGVAAVLLFEGEGEGLRLGDAKRFGAPRFFAYYTPAELSDLMAPSFEVFHERRLDLPPRPTLLAAGRVPARRA